MTTRSFAAMLCAEDQAAAGRGVEDLARHLGARLQQEVQAAAMHRDENVRLELLDLGDHLLEIILRRRPEMKAADDGGHLLDTGDPLRLPPRIDDADVAAGADHHQALAADVEA